VSETFEEWLKNYFSKYEVENELGGQLITNLTDCWNHQQNKIDELESKLKTQFDMGYKYGVDEAKGRIKELKSLLKECREELGFYGEIDHWHFDKTDRVRSEISMTDLDEDSWGGKRAREFEAKNKARLDEIFGRGSD